MSALFSALIGYILGSINPAYIIAKIKGFDIRNRGSGNAGASNAVITMGKTAGAISALFDIAKAYFAVKLAQILFPTFSLAHAIAGTSCILGHIFPLFMAFRGGKGLACLGGVILSFDLRVFLVMLVIELILVLVVDYICIVPITASISFPIVYFVITKNVYGSLILSIASIIMLYKHIENIRRIRNGSEAHFSLLWRRNEELERVQNNTGNNN